MEAPQRLVRLPGGAHAVERLRPYAPAPVAGAAFVGEHVGHRRAVVAEAVDKRHAGLEQRPLEPAAVVGPDEMGEQAVVAVAPVPAIGESDPTIEDEFGECLPRPGCEGPCFGVGPGHLGSLNADQADRLSVGEPDGIAVDDFDHRRRALDGEARRHRYRATAGGACAKQEEGDQDDPKHRASIRRSPPRW